jgi:hypothetical protein
MEVYMAEKVPLAVLAACARRGLAVGDLDGWQVTADDVFLSIKTGEVIRIELSALPEIETQRIAEPEPVTTTPVVPVPVVSSQKSVVSKKPTADRRPPTAKKSAAKKR